MDDADGSVKPAYKKACRAAWNEACDRVDSDDEPLTALFQPQLKPRRRDKATAAARRAWAQIAKPVTEETFTAWYIANVAKEKRDPAPAPPARPGRRPARPTIYEAAIVPEDATKAMSSIARGGGVGPVVTLPLPLPLL